MSFRLVRLSSVFLLLLSLLLFSANAAGTQHEVFSLIVNGEVGKPPELNLGELSKMPRRTISAKNHDGKECSYEGGELREILIRAGVKFGKELKGRLLASSVLVEAADKYQVVFALPELDSRFTEQVILLADTCDGKPLPESNGPLQIIVPGEKRHARWVRQVKSLTVVYSRKKAEGATR